MRRVRQSSAGLSPAIAGRISAAIGLSVALHVFLIYGFSLPVVPHPAAQVAVIAVHLQPPQAVPSSRPAKPPGFNRAAEFFPPTLAVEPPALTAAAEAVTAPAAEPATKLVAAPMPASLADDTRSAAASREGSAGLSIPDPVHYPAKELDIYPQALTPIAPVYPQAAREAQVGGFVTLMVSIDEAGRVVDTTVTDAAPGGVFEQVAQQALSGAAFYPAQKEGRTVRSRILVKVEFDPTLTDAAQ